MSLSSMIILALLFFVTSVIGVVTGSNSLITVPVMFQFGVDPKVAVATNMFGLTFMAVGASLPIMRRGVIEYGRVTPLVVITVISSAIGAALVGWITDQGIKLVVSAAMIVVAVFILVKRNAGTPTALDGTDKTIAYDATAPPPTAGGTYSAAGRHALVYFLTFLLGIYGGLYSGGYVTILTAVYVAFFGMTFTEAVGSTKFINIFSSLVATVVFAWQGLIDYRLGIVLAAAMFAGGYVGAHYAAKLNDLWIKRIFLAAVFLLAIKTLFDLLLG
jgi:uncharacterized protein